MSGLIILRMAINMDESQLRTIEQIEQFLDASAQVAFTAHGDDVERYAHISRVLKRFDIQLNDLSKIAQMLSFDKDQG